MRDLHAAGAPMLRLPNAWDVASARLFERAGARAIATSSAAVAWAHGFPDGERLPLADLVALVARLVRVLRVPLTVDVERGYGDPMAAVARLADAGAAGVNLEDGGGDADAFARRLATVRAARPEVFLNARTCVVLHRSVAPDATAAELCARARRYADAGADGFFVPGLVDLATMATVARATPLPLNVFTMAGLPPLAELARAGVRRVSTGPALFEAAYAEAVAACAAFLGGEAAGAGLTYAEMNGLFGG